MKKLLHCLLIVSFMLQLDACSTSRANINYKGFDADVQVHSGAVTGTELGAVRGNQGGEIWSNCTEKASDSLHELIADAKSKGANAVGNLKWYATGDTSPACKSGWGYLIVWPFVLTPLFMSTEVEGVAYKVDRPSKSSGFFMIPDNQKDVDSLVHRLVTAQN